MVFEGVPTYPDAGRFWKMIQDHKITIFYTAPTAIRSLVKASDTTPSVAPTNYDLSLAATARHRRRTDQSGGLGCWYYNAVGGGRCPIVDTFWQTETGGHMITPLPGVTPLVPGSCTLPFPGIQATIVDETGTELEWGKGGLLVVSKPWPSMIRTIWGDPGALQAVVFPGRLPGQALPRRRRRGTRCAYGLLYHHRPDRRCTQCIRTPAWERWKSNRPLVSPPDGRRSGGGWPPRRNDG